MRTPTYPIPTMLMRRVQATRRSQKTPRRTGWAHRLILLHV